MGRPTPFETLLIAETLSPVTTTGGMRVLADHTFSSCPKLDILLVPGGPGTRKESNNPTILDWLRSRTSETEILASVCTGSLVLGSAGLLVGHRATTHWRWLDWMRDSFPQVTVDYYNHVVEDGSLLTSARISAGIDLALRIVSRYCGEAIARATAKNMEYPYPGDDDRRIRF